MQLRSLQLSWISIHANMYDLSIIIATYNSGRTLQRTLDSIAAQQDCRIQVIVKDAQSNDDTLAIVERAGSLVQVCLSCADRGIYDAWNQALPHAQAEWICFLGSDDELSTPTAVRRLLDGAACRPPGVRIVYSNVEYVNSNGQHLHMQGEPWAAAGPKMSRQMAIPHVGTLHHRSLFFDDGRRFDVSFRIAGDFALVLPECTTNGAHYVADTTIARAEFGGVSTRPDYEWRTHKEVRQALALVGPVPLFWYRRAMHVLFRTLIFRLSGEQGLRRYEALKSHVYGVIRS